MKKFYNPVRSLHLYAGLFVSPFVLIFSLSVLALNHFELFRGLRPAQQLPEVRAKLREFPAGDSDLSIAKAIIRSLGIHGEVDFISRHDSIFSFPLNTPGLTKHVVVNVNSGEVLITAKDEGIFSAVNYLHTMPGQHNMAMRGNAPFMKIWRVMTDMVVYLVLFLTATGVFLWYFLKPERKLGLITIGSGFLIFSGLLILIFSR